MGPCRACLSLHDDDATMHADSGEFTKYPHNLDFLGRRNRVVYRDADIANPTGKNLVFSESKNDNHMGGSDHLPLTFYPSLVSLPIGQHLPDPKHCTIAKICQARLNCRRYLHQATTPHTVRRPCFRSHVILLMTKDNPSLRYATAVQHLMILGNVPADCKWQVPQRRKELDAYPAWRQEGITTGIKAPAERNGTLGQCERCLLTVKISHGFSDSGPSPIPKGPTCILKRPFIMQSRPLL